MSEEEHIPVTPEPPAFTKGDRVFLHGLTAAPHLNGRHGWVAAIGLRCAVHLDWPLKTVMIVSPRDHLLAEPKSLASYALSDRPDVYNGALFDPSHHPNPVASASGLIHLLRLMRWTAATMQRSSSSSSANDQISSTNLTLQGVTALSTEPSLALNAYAIQHWRQLDEAGKENGIRHRMLEYLRHHQSNLHFDTSSLQQALCERRAMASWHCGIQQDFWFVGRDTAGTYVVPEANKDVVYKIVGVVNAQESAQSKKPGDSVSIVSVPMRMSITVFPWYGRLLYDTTIAPPKPENVVYAHQSGDPSLVHRLHNIVLLSIQAGRVIEHLAELEHSPE